MYKQLKIIQQKRQKNNEKMLRNSKYIIIFDLSIKN